MTALATPEVTPTSATADPVIVTPNAIRKIYQLMTEEGNLDLKLRIFITGGGCSGFQYGFSFEEVANDDDFLIKKTITETAENNQTDLPQQPSPSIYVLIDALSKQYLEGAEVDYCKDIQGERFIIRGNPNAKTTCGCGSSFSAE